MTSSRLVIPPAEHVQILNSQVSGSSRRARFYQQLQLDMTGDTNYTTELSGAAGDSEYVTDITVGGQTFQVIIDTGSSDTWFPAVNFTCLDMDGNFSTPDTCGFGSDGFGPSLSSTFVEYPDVNFNISYASDEYLTGTVGFESVTVGELTVTNQTIGLVKVAAWSGDNVTSGILGLAYPNLTDVYPGNDPSQDSYADYLPYNPFFFTAIEQMAVSEPYFSIALNRPSSADDNSTSNDHLGYLAFGGIAPVAVTDTSITVPVQGYTTQSGSSAYFYYTIDIDSYDFAGSDDINSTSMAILDTGTTLNYLPSMTTMVYNSLFDPPAVLNQTDGYYYVDCNAVVPDFSVVVGGVNFTVDTRDQIFSIGPDEDGNELCISGTQDADALFAGGIYILGDVFLRNVVTTFAVSSTVPTDNTITLSQREPY